MSVYVAGPMSGITGFNYQAFDAAERALQIKGFDVLNPVANDAEYNPGGLHMPWDWYMRHAIRMVIRATGMAMLPGWQKSTGATLEHHIGKSLGLDIRELEEWL